MSCDYLCSATLPHGAMCWSAVCVIVVFCDHTHLLFSSTFFLCGNFLLFMFHTCLCLFRAVLCSADLLALVCVVFLVLLSVSNMMSRTRCGT